MEWADRDRGSSAIGYLGILLLVSAVCSAIVAVGVPDRIGDATEAAMCKVTGEDCQAQRTSQADNGTAPQKDAPLPSLLPTRPLSGEQPEQTTGPTAEPPPVRVPDEQASTEAMLSKTQRGRDALEWARKNGVRVVYRAGGGSFYDPKNSGIYLDTQRIVNSPVDLAGDFIHELNHAKHPGPGKDLSREDYIDKAIDEEVEGTFEQIQNTSELQDIYGDEAPHDGLQREYEDAYGMALYNANRFNILNNRPPLSLEAERQLGEKAGRQRLKDAYESGVVVASTNGRPYRENFGKEWDDAHACGLWVFC